MLHGHVNTLQLTQLSTETLNQLSPSFSQLPHTEHADGQYRLRRYSVITFSDGVVSAVDDRTFVQSDDINRFQGNVVRSFEPLLSTTLNSAGLNEMCRLFVETNGLPNGQEIEIHQMRISAVFDETAVAPEGVHQDGFDHIALIGIERHNIVGGEIMLYANNNEAPFFRKVLENGEVTMLADSKLWHNACPIRTVVEGEQGYMDLFVLTAKGEKNALHS